MVDVPPQVATSHSCLIGVTQIIEGKRVNLDQSTGAKGMDARETSHRAKQAKHLLEGKETPIPGNWLIGAQSQSEALLNTKTIVLGVDHQPKSHS